MILGVDIGNKGAMSIIDGNRIVAVFDVPIINESIYRNKGGKPAPILDIKEVNKCLPKVKFAVIEEPITPFNKTSQCIINACKRGMGFGMWLSYFKLKDIPFYTVKPATWKKALGITKDKQSAIDACHDIFGESAKEFITLKKHDGRAEASTIAWYGLKCLDLK